MAQKATYDPATKRFVVEQTTLPSFQKPAYPDLSKMTKEELLDEGKRLCKTLYNDYNQSRPCASWGKQMVTIWEDGSICKGCRVRRWGRGTGEMILSETPHETLERIVANGRSSLRKLEKEIDDELMKNPEIVAEGVIDEGLSRKQLIDKLYSVRFNELQRIFAGVYPKHKTYFQVCIDLEGREHKFDAWLKGGYYPVQLSCGSIDDTKDKLVFLREFDKVKAEFTEQRRCFK